MSPKNSASADTAAKVEIRRPRRTTGEGSCHVIVKQAVVASAIAEAFGDYDKPSAKKPADAPNKAVTASAIIEACEDYGKPSAKKPAEAVKKAAAAPANVEAFGSHDKPPAKKAEAATKAVGASASVCGSCEPRQNNEPDVRRLATHMSTNIS